GIHLAEPHLGSQMAEPCRLGKQCRGLSLVALNAVALGEKHGVVVGAVDIAGFRCPSEPARRLGQVFLAERSVARQDAKAVHGAADAALRGLEIKALGDCGISLDAAAFLVETGEMSRGREIAALVGSLVELCDLLLAPAGFLERPGKLHAEPRI